MTRELLELMGSVPPEHFERLMRVQAEIADRENRGNLTQENHLRTPKSAGLHSPVTDKMRTQ